MQKWLAKQTKITKNKFARNLIGLEPIPEMLVPYYFLVRLQFFCFHWNLLSWTLTTPEIKMILY